MMKNPTGTKKSIGRKKFILSARPVFVILGLLFWLTQVQALSAQTTENFTNPGAHEFTVPAGVTEITLQVWGAGGAGGEGALQGQTRRSGGGGGGGAYHIQTISVNPGESITITVGSGGASNAANGNPSVVIYSATTITAAGGSGGANATTGGQGTSGAGGPGGIGETFNGGDGANGAEGFGGGGGSSAGTASNGNNAVGVTGGTAVSDGGGGGNGATADGGSGFTGVQPGGGGGGGRGNGSSGGFGGHGQVIVTYTEIVEYTLTINISGSGNVEVDGVEYSAPLQFNEGTSVSLEALADAGWEFDGWSGNLSSTNPTENIIMDDDKTITATFSEESVITYTISGTVDDGTSPLENVQITATGGHSQTVTTNASGQYILTSVAEGAENIVITPSLAGYTFAPETITVNGPVNNNITGQDFTGTEITYTLTLNIVGNGIVEIDGTPYTAPVQITEGSTVNLEAIADPGWEFDGWAGDITSTNPSESILIDNEKTITATFGIIPDPGLDLRINYLNDETDPTTQNIRPHVRIHNEGDEEVALTDLTFRYWFTSEPPGQDIYIADWAAVGKENILNNFSNLNDERYVEVGFTENATVPGSPANTLPAGINTGVIQGRIHDDGWGDYDQTNDYSWDPNFTAYAEYNKITLYHKGKLVWGTPPTGATEAEQMTITQQPGLSTAGVTMSPAPTVFLEDAFGDPVAGVDVTVSLNKNSFSGGSTIVVSSDANGLAVFDNLRINTADSNYRITFSANTPLIDDQNSVLFNVTAADPDNMVITTQPPAETTAGEVITPAPAVQLLDAFGNPVSGTNITVTLNKYIFESGTTTVETNASGIAEFSDLVITQAAENFILTFNADAAGVDNVNSGSFNIATAAPDQMTIITQPQESVTEGVISGPPTVRLTDAFGNLIQGVNIEVSEASGYIFDAGTLIRATNNSGLAIFNDLQINTIGTGYQLVFNADAPGVDDVTSDLFDVVAPAGSMSIVTHPSATTAGETIIPAPAVLILDGLEDPLSGVEITVSLNQFGFAHGTTTVASDASGIATFDDLIIQAAETGYEITFNADLTGISDVFSDPFDVVPANAASMSVNTQPLNTTAGQTIGGPPAVTIVDAFGNPVSGIPITVSTNKNEFASGTTTVSSNSQGIATFTDLVITTAETGYQLEFDADAAGVGNIQSAVFNITAAAPHEMTIVEQPTETSAGSLISPPPSVLVTDVYNNPRPGVDVTASLNKNSFTGGSTVIVTTNSSGLAEFSNLAINIPDSDYQITFGSTGLDPVTSDPFSVVQPDPPFGSVRLQYENNEPKVSANQIQPFVRLFNDSDVNVAIDEITVRYWFTSEPAGDDVHQVWWLQMGIPNSNVTGSFDEINGEYFLEMAFSPDIVLPIGLGGDGNTANLMPPGATTGQIQQGIQSTDGDTYDQSDDYSWDPAITTYTDYQFITVYYKGQLVWGIPPAAAEGGVELVFDQQPTDTFQNTIIDPPIVVHILDREGSLAIYDNSTEVSITIANDPSGNAGLSGTTQVTASEGIAVFDDLSINNPGTGYTLEVSAGEMTSDISDPFNIESDEPANITFIADPENPVAGETSLLTATVTNNTDTPLENVTITFSVVSGNGILSVVSAVTDPSGEANTVYTTSTTVEAASIEAVVDAVPALNETVSVSSVAGPPEQLAFAVQPNNSAPEIIITPPVTVRIEDQHGNLVTDATDVVQMAINDNPGGGTLNGNLNVAAVNGIATFNDLSIDETGIGYTLIASSGSLTSVISDPFDIAAGTPAKLEFEVQPTNTVAGEAITPAMTVRILDATNTWVETATNTVTLSIANNPGGGGLSGTISKAAVDGVATFDNISIDKIGEGYTIAATSSGLSSDSTNPFDILVADAAIMIVTQQPPVEVTAGTAISPAPAVLVTDDFGNPIEGVDITISLNKNDFDAGNTIVSTDASGVAAFPGLIINSADTAYELIFNADAPGVDNSNSNPFEITAANPDNMIITVQPLHSVAGDFLLGPPTVQVRDAFNNPVAGINVSVSLNQNNFSSGTTVRATNALGNASFNDLIITNVADNYQIIFDADAAEVSNVTSDPFNIIVDRTISGTILDTMGNPVAGVTVTATNGHDQVVTTNSAGFYQLTGIQSGNRTVNITPSMGGYVFDPPSRSISNNFSNTPNITGQNFTAIPVADTYYSRQTGNWNNAESWSTTSHTGDAAPRPPDADDTMIIANGHEITLTGDVVNDASVSLQNTGTLITGPYILSGTGNFTLAAGGTLHVGSADGITISGNSGNIQISGSRSFSEAANYTYNGTALQQTGNGLPAIINNLTINNSSGVEALSDQIVVGQLILTGGTLTMPPGSSLVTYSVTGIGQVKMQQQIAGGKGWRMVAAPVGANYGDLFDGFVTQGYTGATFPGLQPNILWFNETEIGTTNMAWRIPENATDNVPGGRGHFQYIFNGSGLPDEPGNYTDDLPIVMSASGQEHMSGSVFNFNISYTERLENNVTDTDIPEMNTGWNLVGNPTTASLDWEAATGWTRTNMDETFYVWVPGANGGEGGFQAWNATITDVEDPDFVPDLNNDGLIAPFQAFWVRANAANPLFSMSNDVKATGGAFEQKAEQVAHHAPMNKNMPLALKLQADGLTAHAYITFSEKGKIGEDPWDAYQLEPMGETWLKLFTTTSEHHLPMVINNMPKNFGDMLHIPVYIEGVRNKEAINGTYALNWSIPSWWPANWRLTLMDHEQKESIPMQEGTTGKAFRVNSIRQTSNPTSKASSPLIPPKQVLSGEYELATSSNNGAHDASVLKNTGISFNSKSTLLQDAPRFSILVTTDAYPDEPGYIALTPELLPPYPNPASRNSETNIRFSLSEADHVTIRILDLHGRHVQTLANRSFSPGIHYMSWFPGSLNRGIYFVVLQTGDTQRVEKLILGP